VQIDSLLVRVGNSNNIPRFPARSLVTILTELPPLAINIYNYNMIFQ